MRVDRFRKKPVEVFAVQVTYANRHEVAEWCGGEAPEAAPSGTVYGPGLVAIDTREGRMWADAFDWVIREPYPTDDREFYPCKPDIFEATYDRLSGRGRVK